MLDIRIHGDGAGFAELQDDALIVASTPYPPLKVDNKVIPFIGSLTVDGDGVTTSLSVDGSVTPVDAFVGPPVTGDLYLTTANVLIADSGVIALNRFGGISGGLTNGINFFVELQNERQDISVGLKTNFDFIRVGTLTQGTGGKTDAYQLSNTDPANDDGYNPVIDLSRITPQGIRLEAKSLDKLGVCINDDLTGVATFNIFITGFVRLL